MQLIVNAAFDWAHQGIRVEHFPLGATINTEDADLIEVSTREGWAKQVMGSGAGPSAPEPAPEPIANGASEPEPEPPVAPKTGRGARVKQ